MTDQPSTQERVREIRPGASRRSVIAERVATARCRRPHRDTDPCEDLRLGPEEALYVGEPTVHIPGCMGCAVYGHDRCTCEGTGHD